MISPDRIHRAAARLKRENLRFRSFLKAHADSEELDQHIHRLHRELFAHYDCSKCRNCCRDYRTSLSDNEIVDIAAYLHIPKQEFIANSLIEGIHGYELESPCRFLSTDGGCRIEACKPEECRAFPYTDRPDRLESLLSLISFAEVCPVVFEIVEQLKDIYRFRR